MKHKKLVLALTLAGAGAQAETCDPSAVLIRGDFGSARFAVEVADDHGSRAEGLMNRESLPRFSGMLFVYETPRRASFWMRNTLIPLDMLFADHTGRIVHIHENAVPLDETIIFGGDDVLAVLEINGGMSDQLGIEPGAVLVHPAFDPALAEAPCTLP